MTRLVLTVVTLAGTEYVVFKAPGGGWTFPSGEFRLGETPAQASRRVVREWTKTEDPKLELLDFRLEGEDVMRFVFRALLADDPQGDSKRFPRMGLPSLEGPLAPRDVEDMQKTSLNYKLTRG